MALRRTSWGNPQTMKMLLAALKRIRDKGPTNKDMGICGNVRLLVPRKQRAEIQEKIFSLTQRWPEYKGLSLGYPVEGSGWLYRESMRLGVLWKNSRRIYLLNYMIKELENECSRSAEKDSRLERRRTHRRNDAV